VAEVNEIVMTGKQEDLQSFSLVFLFQSVVHMRTQLSTVLDHLQEGHLIFGSKTHNHLCSVQIQDEMIVFPRHAEKLSTSSLYSASCSSLTHQQLQSHLRL